MKRILTVLCGLLTVASVRAQIIAQWTFEASSASITGTSTTLGGLAAETGTGTASGVHAAASTWSSPAGDGSSHSLSSTAWSVNDYYQFQTSTVGSTGIQLDWDQTSSNTGPGRGLLQWSTDGSLYHNVGTDYTILANAAPNPTWGAVTYQPIFHFTVNLSTVTDLDNAASVFFRLVDDSTTSANGSTVASGGTERVDNFTVSVAVVPEPASLALFGLGLTVLLACRRRK